MWFHLKHGRVLREGGYLKKRKKKWNFKHIKIKILKKHIENAKSILVLKLLNTSHRTHRVIVEVTSTFSNR